VRAEVFDRAPVVILMLANAAAIDTVLGRGTRNSLVERTRATFTASLEGIRQHPPGTISSGFFALMTLDEWVPTPVVEAVLHGIDLIDALDRPAWRRPRASPSPPGFWTTCWPDGPSPDGPRT
jgi:hypothetical protein